MSTKSLPFGSLSSCSFLVCSVFLLVIFLEQIMYLKKKRSLPGPTFVLPFLGNAVSLVRDPTSFWNLQSEVAKSSPLGVSANYIVGKFMVFVRDPELSYKIFTNVRSDGFVIIGHPFGKKIFGKHNFIYLTNQAHKDIRRRIAPNFSPKALSTYVESQQIIALSHLKAWERLSGDGSVLVSLRFLVRNLVLETSETVFAGSYLDGKAREKFNVDFELFNIGLMKLPVDLPRSAFRKAKLASSRLVETLTVCAGHSRAKMTEEAEPKCLVDFWMKENGKEADSNADIGSYLFDFIYAAQDASTSSLLWAVVLLESHPEILRRVREEVDKIWSPKSESPITSEMLSLMRYTQTVAREVVRLRAPATTVPHIAAENFPLTESYTVPKGAIVFPSVFESCLQGFTEPERFDPDRFSDERQEDRVFKRNFLAFGAGTHQCVGQRYALNHLVIFIAMFCSFFDFERERSDGCDEFVYTPTICPKDDCKVFLRRRCT